MARSAPPTTPRGTRGGGLIALVVAAVLAMAMGLVGGLGWWLLRDDAGGLTGSAVSSASVEARDDDGYRVWDRNDDGLPVRWDPCTPIELVVATDGAPTGFADDLEVAIDRLREASGLDLVVVGTTAEPPAARRLPYQPERYGERWAPVLLAWASPETTAARLRDIDRGVATPIAVGRDGDRTYVSGQVVFNRDRDDLVSGFDDRATSWGATILHELGHLLGLGHVDDPDELMAEHPGEGPVRFGPGDRRGLAAVGSDHGCRSTPRPQPVQIDVPG